MTATPKTDNVLAWALWYAENGFRVFPVDRNKNPITDHGFKDATTDPAQVRRWWENHPERNIAVATGFCPEVGITIIVDDADNHPDEGRDGFESRRELELENEPAPDTWTAITGSGGEHRWYIIRDDTPLTIITDYRNGLDYRCNGGYVVVPPSVHANGNQYLWDVDTDHTQPPAPIPDWLERAMIEGTPRLNKQAPTEAGQEVPDAIKPGQREDTIFRIACSLSHKGLTKAEIRGALQVLNQERCTVPLDDKELEHAIETACRYQAGELQPAALHSPPEPPPETEPADPGEVLSVAEIRAALQAELQGKLDNTVLQPEDYTDTDNARKFVEIFGDSLVYSDSYDWLTWDGLRWYSDKHAGTTAAMMFADAMRQEARALYQQAQTAFDAAELKYLELKTEDAKEAAKEAAKVVAAKKAYLAHALATLNKTRISNLVSLASSMLNRPASRIDDDGELRNNYDEDAHLLNTPGGIVNLLTGQLMPHDRARFITHVTATAPGQKGAEMWASFLSQVTGGDTAVMYYLKTVAGMALLGAVYEEGIILAVGPGGCGKSTLFNSIRTVLGDYGGSIAADVLMSSLSDSSVKAELDTLRGKRLIVCGELEDGQRLSESRLKRITSTDPIRACRKYHDPSDFTPSHTILMYSNSLPRVGSTDSGTWRRLNVVPFEQVVPKGTVRKNYESILTAEAGPAILQWCIEGAQMFVSHGYTLEPPQAIQEATAAYRAREDWLRSFIDEACETGPGLEVRGGELYNAYVLWTKSTGTYRQRRETFTDALEAAGFEKVTRGGHKVYWYGLKLTVDTSLAVDINNASTVKQIRSMI